MSLFVDHCPAAGNPAYDIPGPVLFLHESRIVQTNPDRRRLHLPMQEVWGHTWEEVYDDLFTLMNGWKEVPHDALVYRGLSVVGGGHPAKPEAVRTLDVGIMYDVPDTFDEVTWTRFVDLEAWWASLDLKGLDEQHVKMMTSRPG